MKCTVCKEEIIINEIGEYICPKCLRLYTKEEIEDIKDGEMIDEDMEIYNRCKKFF